MVRVLVVAASRRITQHSTVCFASRRAAGAFPAYSTQSM